MRTRKRFRSTRPLRGATIPAPSLSANRQDFNPRAPCGARQRGASVTIKPHQFQSTRPLRGATLTYSMCALTRPDFNPRAPCGARPADLLAVVLQQQISIHAPLAGRDRAAASDPCPAHTHFNPRAPCGARPKNFRFRGFCCNFNPRAPCGARPCSGTSALVSSSFQSTRPLRGATCLFFMVPSRYPNFNPRAPCGARPVHQHHQSN